ncbi:OmpH family outer membrane protein [Parvularcula marina]|uniref:OmpH family outer membrane protein n=1 Tax=Parvularcula marina TaxID=2292771 RepID=A0A371RJT8_9PROT|nr:OmpH family outer membrane protein [Parvularcula marina]RFB05711.1 OmpH family outer membrane protein [Parvularcula marina]
MLKKLIAAAAAMLVVGAAPALAQKTAYYDHAKVVNDSNAWKALQAELQTKSAEVASKLKPIADEINSEAAAVEQIVADKTPQQLQSLSDEQKKLVGQWDQKRQALQASQQRVSQEFGLIRELAEAKINEAIVNSLEDVAKSKRVDVIERQTALGHYSSKFDATPEVLAAVNRSLSTLSVDGLVAEVAEAQKQAQAAAQ